jgi:hypothetical protein
MGGADKETPVGVGQELNFGIGENEFKAEVGKSLRAGAGKKANRY